MLGMLFTVGELEIPVLAILDVLIVAYLSYLIYKYVKGTSGVRIFIGVILFLVLLTIVREFEMRLLSLILGSIASIGLISIIVIFQPEIRRFLLMIGNNTVRGRFSFFEKYLKMVGIENQDFTSTVSDKVIKVVEKLSKDKTGALILISKVDNLTFINTGVLIDSLVSVELLETIFNKTTPLHDGAVIIQGERLVAASCILPVSDRSNIPSEAGLRHRAALGASESTNNLTIIVSEENGNTSYAYNNKLYYNVTMDELKIKIKNFQADKS
jgi:uncharacterized protein (TIGR00159 family)